MCRAIQWAFSLFSSPSREDMKAAHRSAFSIADEAIGFIFDPTFHHGRFEFSFPDAPGSATEALAHDWNVIGNDFRRAIAIVAEQEGYSINWESQEIVPNHQRN